MKNGAPFGSGGAGVLPDESAPSPSGVAEADSEAHVASSHAKPETTSVDDFCMVCSQGFEKGLERRQIRRRELAGVSHGVALGGEQIVKGRETTVVKIGCPTAQQ